MKQLKRINSENIIFIEIETKPTLSKIKEGIVEFDLWKNKREKYLEDGVNLKEDFKNRASLYPEFSEICCISLGRIIGNDLVITAYDFRELKSLELFTNGLNLVCKKKPKTILCGFSINNFDIPFIFKRCLINEITPPNLIDVGGLKPWELTSVDLSNLWNGTGNTRASLDEVCFSLNLPFFENPKNEIYNFEKNCNERLFQAVNIFRKCRFESIFENYREKSSCENESKKQLTINIQQ